MFLLLEKTFYIYIKFVYDYNVWKLNSELTTSFMLMG